MNTVYLLLARHGPNDKGEVVSVHATQESADREKGWLDEQHSNDIRAINQGDGSIDIPEDFTATLVVEEREVGT